MKERRTLISSMQVFAVGEREGVALFIAWAWSLYVQARRLLLCCLEGLSSPVMSRLE